MKGTFINISSEKKTMSVIYGYWQRHLLLLIWQEKTSKWHMYYCPRRNIKLLCWLCRIGLNKGFFISNSSKNSLLGEYMISLMSFQILHLWGRITSWSPESSGKHGMGREKYLPYKGRNDKNSAFSSTWNDYKLLQPNHISECTVLN